MKWINLVRRAFQKFMPHMHSGILWCQWLPETFLHIYSFGKNHCTWVCQCNAPHVYTLAKRDALVKFSLSMLNRLLGLNVCHMVSSCFMLMGRVTLEDNVLMLVMSCLDPSWPSNGPGWCHVPHEQQKIEPTRPCFDHIQAVYLITYWWFIW